MRTKPVSPRSTSRAAQGVHWLGVLAWAVPCVAAPLAAAAVGTTGVAPVGMLVPAMGALFSVLVARLVLAARADPGRRLSIACLVAGLLLWATSSVQVSLAPDGAMLQFPAPGEWFGLASGAAFAAHLFVDAAQRVRATLGDWLEAVVAAGGAVCLVAGVVVTPLSDVFARQGVPLLVALTYPAIDLLLLAVVVAQVVLRRRAVSAQTGILVAALVVLSGADLAGSVVNLVDGGYTYTLVGDVGWSLAFILLVDSACRERAEPRPGEHAPGRGLVTVAAAAAALVVLTVQPPGPARPYVVVPADVTFVAAGLRLLLALRQAREGPEAYRLSRTDELTGLPNRRAVTADLAAALRGPAPVSVVLMDLDGFKEVNDSLGHGAGDDLLKIVARRLRHALPDDVTAARLGSDEFALVLPETDPQALVRLVDDVRRLVRRPIVLDGLEVTIEASAGIAVRTDDIATKGDLLRCADVALHQAKQGRGRAVLYAPEQDEFSRARLALAEDLRNGLERGELVVWYQPQVDAVTGAAHSVEALVRWQHPTQGLLGPFAFLPAARRAGLMPRLTEVVLATAIRDLAGWTAQGADLKVAVNVAPPELLGGTVLPELGAVLAREGVPADRLVVEVTEDSFLADPDHARRVIHELRSQGVQVSIDDYGTGFSSLAYLRDLPLQELKIDRSFVADILTDPRSWMIVSTTAQLARGLGLRVVAEGVEDADQQEALARLGVDLLQGFHFAKPMPADALLGWLAGRPALPAAARTAGQALEQAR